ncbi:putative Gnk2-like domain-containing protein [Helianthus debilis subsp. tardiflorus]
MPKMCRRCYSSAATSLSESNGGWGWYGTCFLWYSNRTIGGGVCYYFYNGNNVSDSSFDQWNQTVVDLLGELWSEAAGGGQLQKYASRNITVPGLWTVYGMMQCTPDLSKTECDDCFVRSSGEIRRFARSLGVICFWKYNSAGIVDCL